MDFGCPGWPETRQSLCGAQSRMGFSLRRFLYSVYTSFVITRPAYVYSEPINWISRVNLTYQILQALLAGFLIFSWLIINEIHNLITEQRFSLSKDVSALTELMKKLEFSSRVEAKRVEVANARALELKNRVDNLHLKYDKLLEYNQTIQNQLQCITPDLENNEERRCSMIFDNEAEAMNRCRQYLFPDSSHSLPLPRHCRPIYQCRCS